MVLRLPLCVVNLAEQRQWKHLDDAGKVIGCADSQRARVPGREEKKEMLGGMQGRQRLPPSVCPCLRKWANRTLHTCSSLFAITRQLPPQVTRTRREPQHPGTGAKYLFRVTCALVAISDVSPERTTFVGSNSTHLLDDGPRCYNETRPPVHACVHISHPTKGAPDSFLHLEQWQYDTVQGQRQSCTAATAQRLRSRYEV